MSVTGATDKQNAIVTPPATPAATASAAKPEDKKPAIDLNLVPDTPPPDLRAFYDAALNPKLPATSITAHNACVKDYALMGHIAGHVAGEIVSHKIHAGIPGMIVLGFGAGQAGGELGHKVGEKVCPPAKTPDFLPNVPKTTSNEAPATTAAPAKSEKPEPTFTSVDPAKNVCK
jgi:hypothetical protein